MRHHGAYDRRNMQAQDNRHAGPPNDLENCQHGCHHYERRSTRWRRPYKLSMA